MFATAAPRALVGLPEGKRVVGVSGGFEFTYALTTKSGEVYVFGDGAGGGLGLGPNTDDVVQPTLLKALQGRVARSVALGARHGIALCEDDEDGVQELMVWGSNEYGQIALSRSDRDELAMRNEYVMWNPVPGVLPENVQVTEVACCSESTLLLSDDGRLFGCGLAYACGHPTNCAQFRAVSYLSPRGELELFEDVQRICTGHAHALALTSTGDVYSFGYNTDGCLGRALPDGAASLAGMVDAVADVTDVAAGDCHSLCATESGVLYAWGRNTQGQLGIRNEASALFTPEPVVFPGEVASAESLTEVEHTETEEGGATDRTMSPVPMQTRRVSLKKNQQGYLTFSSVSENIGSAMNKFGSTEDEFKDRTGAYREYLDDEVNATFTRGFGKICDDLETRTQHANHDLDSIVYLLERHFNA